MDYTRLRMLAQLGHLAFSEEPTAPEGGGDAPDAPQEGAGGEGDEQGDEGGDESQEDEQEPFNPEKALAEVRKARDQAAKYRTRLREAEEKAAEKASGADELTKTISTKDSEILRLRVALKHGLPEGLANRLQGSSEEELLADAEELMGLFSPKNPPSQSPKRKTQVRTPDSAEDGVDIDKLALDQLSS